MRAPIAKIRINAGNPGWYDPLTNIHLTITRPEALVYEGSNTTNIKRSISHGLIHILEGSLEEQTDNTEIEAKQEIVKEVREVNPQVETKTEEVITETVEEKVVVEETEEATNVVEKKITKNKTKTKKTSARKKTTKKEKDTE